jgi:hypothetical protein
MPLRAKLACATSVPAILALILMFQMAHQDDGDSRGIMLRVISMMIAAAVIAALLTHLYHRQAATNRALEQLRAQVNTLAEEAQAREAFDQLRQAEHMPEQRRHLRSTTPGV